MAYYTEITTSQTWVCPRTGDYKITCVAGGSGLTPTTTVPGGSTSFGTYMTCSGHIIANSPPAHNNEASNGYVPGNPGLYGTHTFSGGSLTVGYGAAGAISRHTTTGVAVDYGLCGRLERKIVHIEKGEKIACTIGAGGASSGGTGNNPWAVYGVSGFISIQEV